MMSYRFLHVKIDILDGLRYALLGALADQPRTATRSSSTSSSRSRTRGPRATARSTPSSRASVEDGLIEQTGAGARNSKTYALTDAGLDEIRRWLASTTPERRVRNDAALRTFFLWLLEPDEAVQQLERERDYCSGDARRVPTHQRGADGREQEGRTFRIALEGGIRDRSSRALEWLGLGDRADPIAASGARWR